MNFDIKNIVIAEAAAKNAIVGFYGEYRFLSNFWYTPVKMYGITFPTVEHAFAAAKIDPTDGRNGPDPYQKMRDIAAMKKPQDAKRAGGRRGIVVMREDWDTVKEDLVLELIRRKFANPVLREKLLATGDRDLYEFNTHGDDIWGLLEKTPGVMTGRSMLGEMLMFIRAEIRAEIARNEAA